MSSGPSDTRQPIFLILTVTVGSPVQAPALQPGPNLPVEDISQCFSSVDDWAVCGVQAVGCSVAVTKEATVMGLCSVGLHFHLYCEFTADTSALWSQAV